MHDRLIGLNRIDQAEKGCLIWLSRIYQTCSRKPDTTPSLINPLQPNQAIRPLKKIKVKVKMCLQTTQHVCFNRPGVAGAVLQTPLLLINQVGHPLVQNLQDTVYP